MANCAQSIVFSTTCLIILLNKSNGFSIPSLKLLSGHEMPVIGIVVSQFTRDVAENWTIKALNIGHRFIDGAYEYENEKEIGRGLKTWLKQGNKREDLFIMSKLPMQGLRPEDVSLYLNTTLSDLDLEYVDMYLLHFPTGSKRTKDLQVAYNSDGTLALDITTDLIALWKEMENQVKAGRVKSIGFSNFNKTQLLKVWENSEIKPSNLQMENNAYLQQAELVEFAQSLGIVVSGYSPAGSPGDFGTGINNQTVIIPELVDHPLVKKIAANYKKTPVQIVNRYNLQRNLIVNAGRFDPNNLERDLKDDLEILNLTLNKKDIRLLKSLDQRGRYRKYSRLEMRGIQNHPEYPWPEFAEQELNVQTSGC